MRARYYRAVGDCLDEDDITELLHGMLAPAAKEAVAGHLGSCADCRQLVAETALALSGPGQSPGDSAPLRAGATLGRYVVIAPVGGGSMGLVYAAFIASSAARWRSSCCTPRCCSRVRPSC